MTRLLIVGGGRMGHALAGGLLRSGWIAPGDLAIAEQHAETRHELAHRFDGVTVTERCVAADSAVLAVKPADALRAAASLAELGIERVVSIVAGLRIADLSPHLAPGARCLRAMPNMPAIVGAAASALAGGPEATEDDFAWAESVLSSIGVVARVPEYQLDAVTGLSGSGPAYVFLLAEALVEAGVSEGLDREVSRLLAYQTILGAARALAELGETAAELRARVTSPGGTTAAGVRELERHALRAAVLEAVAAATARSRELGQPPS